MMTSKLNIRALHLPYNKKWFGKVSLVKTSLRGNLIQNTGGPKHYLRPVEEAIFLFSLKTGNELENDVGKKIQK